MSTTPLKTIEKEFDSKYNNPQMKLMLEEEGWIYRGTKNDNPIFEYFY